MWAEALFALLGQLFLAVAAIAFLLQLFRPFRFILHSVLAVTIVAAALVVMVVAEMRTMEDLAMTALSIAQFALMAWPLAFAAALLGGLLRHFVSRISQRTRRQH
jgi:hypothetical protein